MDKIKLTQEQSDIVAENYKLIAWYCKETHTSYEEWSGLLGIELCKAVIKHNPEKSSLSNYYKLRCDCLLRKEYQKTQAQKRFNNGMVSLDDVYSEESGEDEIGYNDVDGGALEELFGSEYGEVIRLKHDGYTQGEIADKLGLSQSQISKILKKVRKEYDE